MKDGIERDDERISTIWRHFLEEGEIGALEMRSRMYRFEMRVLRQLLRRLPTSPRCKWCYAPFRGVGAPLMTAIGKSQSSLNPMICSECENWVRKHEGGAEVEIAMLFADIRGSTALAESISTIEFSKLINRFFKVSTDVLASSGALIDKLIGDEVVAIFVSGMAGSQFVRRAIGAADELLRATGHTDAEGPWVPVGVGVHSGMAYVGAVGSADGVTDITALGDVANTAARLASQAAPGEVVVSETALAAAGLDSEGLEQRQLELKGKREPVVVRVLQLKPD